MKICSYIVTMFLLFTTVSACGGGGGGGGTGSSTPPPATYNKALVTINTAALVQTPSANLQAVKVVLQLPQEVVVNSTNVLINSTFVDSGSIIYDSSLHQLSMHFTGTPIVLGNLAVITVTMPGTTAPDKNVYQFVSKELKGLSQSGTTVDLSTEVSISVSDVTFQ